MARSLRSDRVNGPTLLAEPRRTVFLTAKMLSSITVGLFFGVVDSGMAAGLLSSWLGFTVLLGYAIAFALIGRITTLRHDIT